MSNWPYPDKPGVPFNPERDGWHWLKHPEDLHPVMMGWISELQGWSFGRRHSPKGIVDMGYQYLGSTLLPAEVAAKIEQARRDGIEAAMRVVSERASARHKEAGSCISDRSRKHMHIRADEAGQIVTYIRALLPGDSE